MLSTSSARSDWNHMANETPVLTISVFKRGKGFSFTLSGGWEGEKDWRNTGLLTQPTGAAAVKAAIGHVQYVAGLRQGPRPRGHHVAKHLV